jgi:hypothetical protein
MLNMAARMPDYYRNPVLANFASDGEGFLRNIPCFENIRNLNLLIIAAALTTVSCLASCDILF